MTNKPHIMTMKYRLTILAMACLMLLPSTGEARRKKDMDKEHKVSVVAHRGFWNCEEAGYARNSIAALRCAQEAGFWGSEFDVNMTKDSVLIIFHDSDVEGKKIEKHPYEAFTYFRLENGEPIPTIDKYLEQGKKYPETMLVYELKTHSTAEIEDTFVDLTIAKLEEHGLLDPERVMFISFSFHMCERLARKLPGFTVQYLNGDKKPSKVREAGISGIDYNHAILTLNGKWIEEAKEEGMSVNTWTVNKDSLMVKMIEKGVDQLTTDNPLQAREVIRQMGLTEQR